MRSALGDILVSIVTRRLIRPHYRPLAAYLTDRWVRL